MSVTATSEFAVLTSISFLRLFNCCLLYVSFFPFSFSSGCFVQLACNIITIWGCRSLCVCVCVCVACENQIVHEVFGSAVFQIVLGVLVALVAPAVQSWWLSG